MAKEYDLFVPVKYESMFVIFVLKLIFSKSSIPLVFNCGILGKVSTVHWTLDIIWVFTCCMPESNIILQEIKCPSVENCSPWI